MKPDEMATTYVTPSIEEAAALHALGCPILDAKPLKASEIIAQGLDIARLNLYFRPVYAFEFEWVGHDQKVIFEIDGVTGRLSEGHRTSTASFETLNEANLFDIGADALGLVIPGGEIAAKLAAAFLGKKK